MNKDIIDEVKDKFGPVEWHAGPFKILPGDWFLLKLNPLPPIKERKLVVSDICKGNDVWVSHGKVYHLDDCNQNEHKISSRIRCVEEILDTLEDEKFHVAVYPGNNDILNGQPVAIALEPEINYKLYPDHKHINSSRPVQIGKRDFFLPESLCYTDSPSTLGYNQVDRLLTAFDYITIWLFRHQIWLATREQSIKGVWIGPEAELLPPSDYPKFLDPVGLCRCGKNKKYSDCHRPNDLKKAIRKFAKENNFSYKRASKEFIKAYQLRRRKWNQRQLISMEKLKNILL